MAITHDVVDRTLPKSIDMNPKIAPNVSVIPPAPSNGGSVSIVGTGVDRRVANERGPYQFEVPRQPRDV
jgi:hypothetical protein